MVTCAIVGPDGSGKTTVCRRLEHELPLDARYIYMGVSTGSSNVMLPTTRLIRAFNNARGAAPDTTGPRPHDEAVAESSDTKPNGSRRRGRSALRAVKASAGLANRIAEEWYRQALASYHALRGRVVLFDRHFFADYHAYDIVGSERDRSRLRRLHGWMLARLFPKPALVVYLDAPAEVLLARKGEGTVEVLERRRLDYLQLRGAVDRFHVVDATQPLEDVVREVGEHILAMARQDRDPSHGIAPATARKALHARD